MMLKRFIFECLFFTKPREGSIIPNWILGIYSWMNIFLIIITVLSMIY